MKDELDEDETSNVFLFFPESSFAHFFLLKCLFARFVVFFARFLEFAHF